MVGEGWWGGGGGGGGGGSVWYIYIMERGFTLHWPVCWKKETVKVSSPYKADVTPGFHDVSLRKLFKHAVQGVKSLAFQTEHTESVSCVLPKSSFHLFQCHEGLLICMRCCVFLLRFVKGKGKKFSLTCFYIIWGIPAHYLIKVIFDHANILMNVSKYCI